MTFDDFDTQIQCDEQDPPPGWDEQVDSGQARSHQITYEAGKPVGWTVMERCPHCNAVSLRPLSEDEFAEWWRTAVADIVECDRCRSDPR